MAEDTYPARLEIDYPEALDRVTTPFRLIWAIPIVIILSLLTATASETVTVVTEAGETVSKVTQTGVGIMGGLFVAATMLMIVFRQRYPRWWFDFALELTRFETRVGAFLALLTDRYPSTVEEQSVHLEIEYPDVERDLSRGLPRGRFTVADVRVPMQFEVDLSSRWTQRSTLLRAGWQARSAT